MSRYKATIRLGQRDFEKTRHPQTPPATKGALLYLVIALAGLSRVRLSRLCSTGSPLFADRYCQ